MFDKIYENLIADLEIFYLKNEAFNTKRFIDNIEACMMCLKEMDNEALSKINYIRFSDLISMRDRCNEGNGGNEGNEGNEELKICEFAFFLLHYYTLYTKNELESDEWIEKANTINEHIKDYFLEQKRHSTLTYYKNLILEEEQADFEIVLELLSNQLKRYDVNLYHCKKILDFLDKYYPDKIFPEDTFFLNNYLGNTVDLMILTVSKLYLDDCDVEKKKNCGIKYLQSFIGKKVCDKSNIKDTLKTTSTKKRRLFRLLKSLNQ